MFKKIILILFCIGCYCFVGYKTLEIPGDLATDINIQHIANMVLNASDSTISVYLKRGTVVTLSSDTVIVANTILNISIPDTLTYWQSSNNNNGDTINYKNIYGSRFKFSVTAGPVDSPKVSLFRNGRIDTVRLVSNETYTSDYLDPKKDTAISITKWGVSNKPSYRETSQGR